MRAYKNLPPEKAGLRLHINDSGITPRVARTKEPALVPDTNQESNYVRLVPGIRSELAVPLVQDDRLIGVLNLESRTPQAFDEADVWFLTLLASEAVVAIQNARYVQQLEQLRRVLQTIASTRELQTVLAQIAESTITVLGADDAVIFPYSPEVGEFIPDKLVHRGQARTHFQPGVPREGGIAYTVLEQGLVAVNDVTSAPPELNIVPGTGLLGEIGAQAFVGVTLRVREDGRDKVLGVLYVDHRRPHRFSDTELDLIRTFADQAAIAINNARQETQRRRAERVAAMHTFGGNFIHKVVSRLGTIPAYFEEVKEALERDDKKTLDLWLPYLAMDVQKVEQIMQAAERLKTFQRGERHPLQINQIIQEVISTFDVPENIHLVTDLDPNLPDLTANRLSIEDLLANLIDNAIKAMPHGGKLSLISQGAKDQRWILVKVEDTGAGMSQTVLSRIFEPFYGVRPDGLGLGLWLVQRAVQEMGGEIHVASELGQGTVFTIRLPVEQRSNDERTTSESTSR